MPVNPSDKNCVRDEMRRFKAGELHSGKSHKPVSNKRQALAIALSACGKAKFSEKMVSLGFSQDTADSIYTLMAEGQWDKQFETGTTGNKTRRENKTTKGVGLAGMDIDGRPGKQKGSQGRVDGDSQESLSHVAIPKGNPQPGPRSLQLKGLRAFEEPTEGLTPNKVCPPKKPKPSETAKTPKPITETQQKPEVEQPEKPATERAETKRKKCTPASVPEVGITG
jgi:hypothetical protein